MVVWALHCAPEKFESLCQKVNIYVVCDIFPALLNLLNNVISFSFECFLFVTSYANVFKKFGKIRKRVQTSS